MAVALVVAALAAPGMAQPRPNPGDAYDTAVQIYVQTVDVGRAVAGISRWSIDQLEHVVAEYAQWPDATLPAAAALQLEIAVGTVIQAPGLAATHLDLGQLMIRQLRDRPSATPGDLAEFIERWYVVAASAFLMVNDTRHAETYINRGLQLAPGSADLRLLHGIAAEVDALALEQSSLIRPDALTPLTLQPPAWVGSSSEARRMVAQWTRLALTAERDYRRALRQEPRYARARVRLGRVLAMIGKPAEAQTELERAQADATDATQRYLAALFLGSVHEDRDDLVAARTAYERALSIAPASHAATVALGYLDVMAGRPDRAHTLATALLAREVEPDPWWAYTNVGLEQASLEWLREWVQR